MMKHLSLKQDKPDLRLLYFFIIPFSLVFFNAAWVAEDAFITFRAVDNLLNGYGPVWNAMIKKIFLGGSSMIFSREF